MEAPSYGQIVQFDEKNQTGIIEQYDGERVIFHVNDFVDNDLASMSKKIDASLAGQSVLFRADKNDLGSLQAYEIQIVG